VAGRFVPDSEDIAELSEVGIFSMLALFFEGSGVGLRRLRVVKLSCRGKEKRKR